MRGFKLKSLMVLMFIAGLTLPANAAISISVDGQLGLDEITIAPSDMVTIGIYNSDAGDYGACLVFCYKSEGTYSLDITCPSSVCDDWFVYDDCDWIAITLASWPGALPGIWFMADLHCEGVGDVSVELLDNTTLETLDTLVIHQIEPNKDLGDAPDNSNNFGVPMTAYPGTGVQANYPTVYMTGSPPYGPIHHQPGASVAYLGDSFTLEAEADIGPDSDGLNNIDPLSDVPDQDGADDGILNMPLNLPYCEKTTFLYRVTAVTAGVFVYVNAWFDWNRDGDWDDVLDSCGQAAPEWAVQNQGLVFITPGVYTVESGPFIPWEHLLEQPEPIWMRITVSEQPWSGSGAGGSGPADGYQYGETEDYYFVPTDCFPSNHPDYPEWVAVGKPICWCYPRQCHGDADDQWENVLYHYYVYLGDLAVLKTGWVTPGAAYRDPIQDPWICADFDHQWENVISRFRVYLADLGILKTNWMIPNSPDPNCFDGY